MPVIYSNNASTTLSAGINNSTTTIPIASASGFPTIGSNEYYFATIANTNNTKIEVVKVTAGTTSLTVTRGQDGTTAQAYDSGDNFQLRVTAATLGAATKTDVNITGGAIAGAAISNDAIDSQHYADGSIDHAHLSNDCIDGDNIQDDAIDSEHYTDGSIDTAHIADDAVTADKLANAINTDIAAKLPLAGGTMTGDLLLGANKVGADAGDYMKFTADTQTDWYVNGNNEMRLEADGDLHVDGDVIAFSTTTASSIALKDNVNIIDNALEKLNALRGVSFNYKHDGRESAGVIAEDVQQVLPQAVKHIKPTLESKDKSLGVNYGALTSILIEAIKELTAKVEKLEKK